MVLHHGHGIVDGCNYIHNSIGMLELLLPIMQLDLKTPT